MTYMDKSTHELHESIRVVCIAKGDESMAFVKLDYPQQL